MALRPVSVKNTFLSHFLLWAVFLPLLTVAALPLFVPDQTIDPQEVALVQRYNVDLERMTARSNAAFSAAFVATGVMPATENFFSGHARKHASAGLAARWIRGVWLMVYKCLWRVNVLWLIFLLPAALLCIPAAIDGFAVRARKRFRFQAANPVFFYSSTHAFSLAAGLFVFLPLAPITLTATILSCMIVGMAAAVWVATANFQTGV